MLVQISEPAKGKARQSIDHVVNSSDQCTGCYGLGVVPSPALLVPGIKKAGREALKAFDKANEKNVDKVIGPLLDPSAVPNIGK